MILVLVLVAILAGAGARMVGAGLDSYLTAKTLSPLADQGRLAMERMMAELRGASCRSLSQPDGQNSLQWTNSVGHQLLVFAGRGGEDILIMQVDGGEEKRLLSGVDNRTVRFEVGLDCLVTLEMTLTGTLNGGEPLFLPLRSRIYLGVG